MIVKDNIYINISKENKESNFRAKQFSFNKLLLLDENLRENALKGSGRKALAKSDNNHTARPEIIFKHDSYLNIPIISFIDATDISSPVLAEIKQNDKEMYRFRQEWGM